MLTLTPPPKSALAPSVTVQRPRCKMKIAYLTAEYPKVSHTFIRREIQELERRGHEIVRFSVRPPSGPLVDPADQAEAARTVACLAQSKGDLIRSALGYGLRHPLMMNRAIRTMRRLNNRSDRGWIRHAAYLAEAAFLAKRLKAEGINHVHVHFGSNAAAVALLMKKLANISYSLTVHGPGEFDAPIGLSLAEKVAESTFTNAISHYGRAQLCRWVAPQHWDRIRIVRCTVNPEFLTTPTPIDPRSETLVSVGRLTAQKSPLHLLNAFAKAVRAGGPGRLAFAGDGELRPALERRIADLDLGHRVSITGWLSEAEVRGHIRAARALVLPSAAEGLPVALMEAFALGRPVVSTFTAGIPELVEPGENGWLVPAGDEARLADVLQRVLMTRIDRLESMGLEGHHRVQEYHHPEKEGAKLETIFQEFLPTTGSHASRPLST